MEPVNDSRGGHSRGRELANDQMQRPKEEWTISNHNVYEKISTIGKRELWRKISREVDNHKDERGIIAGDFNATLNNEEKQGGMGRITNI